MAAKKPQAEVIGTAGASEPFRFRLEGSDNVYEIPLAANIPYPFYRKLLRDNPDEMMVFALLDEFCEGIEDEPGLTLKAATDIYSAWQQASKEDGAEPGE